MTSRDIATALGVSQSVASNAAGWLVTSRLAKKTGGSGGTFEALVPPPAPVPTAPPAAWAPVVEASAANEADRDEPEQRSALDLARITGEAALYAPGPFGYLLWVDARCVAAGRPSLSPWWRSPYALRGFYESGKCWGVFCVGRGGGKSTSLEEVAAEQSFFTPRVVYPGQAWAWPFISVNTGDASRRLRGIAAIYKAIGLRFAGEYYQSEKAKEGIRVSLGSPAHMDLEDARGNEIQLLSLAGTIGNVSGPTAIGATIDEAGKLRDRTENANPLTEILTSLVNTFRARPGIRAICCSSAYERSGAHFQMIEDGDTLTNFVARIGAPFLDAALRGFEQVAMWEQNVKRNPGGAAQIRTHAASINGNSPLVPTWIANPTLGNPDPGVPWDGAALASRLVMEAIPEGSDKLEGLPRHMLWLRECGSLPMDRGGGFDARAQLFGLADANIELQRRIQGGAPRQPGPMTHPLAPHGDPRHAGYRASGGAGGSGLARTRIF